MKLELTPEEVQAILQVLAQLPNSSGTYPLLVKIKQQVDEQMQSSD